ncbi:leukocyte elastase inhibitor-like [Epargyreus clarus]|uniref:leukocyte elastase inhibitor-like n=1 Tax=Epargyreus clarus TaxID=520877 RepID=UPI003C2ACD02
MMKLITLPICLLILGVESQYYDANGQYNSNVAGAFNTRQTNIGPSKDYQFAPIAQTKKSKASDYDSYVQAISRNPNLADPQQTSQNGDGSIHFVEPSLELRPPPYGTSSTPNYYSTQQKATAAPLATPGPYDEATNYQTGQGSSVTQPQVDNQGLNNVTVAISNFGLNLMKIASQLQQGNIIISPTSIATVLALLQQGATGDGREQITRALQMTPEASEMAFGSIVANMRKRNSRNILSIANNILVADAFELNNAFKSLAVRGFWSEVTPTNFGKPVEAAQWINGWVASKTNNKITNLLQPGMVSANTQLILVNAVYFKGLWETKFKPEKTQMEPFNLRSGAKKTVPFMHIRHSFQVGFDLNTRALVTILPFESRQYSLMLILPKKSDNVENLLETLTVEQLLSYHKFSKVEIKVEIPKFTLKTDTELNPVLKNMGITNIFGSKTDLSGIGLYRNFSPQISNAVHSGFLSVDEQGVTAAAATAFAAVALSYDESATIFRADRPFIAVLWDSQFSIPLFIAKIEDPS